MVSTYPGVESAWARRAGGAYRDVSIFLRRTGAQPLDSGFTAGLLRFLKPLELIGDRVSILPAEQIKVNAQLNLVIAPGWPPAMVRAEVRAAIELFFDKLGMGQPVHPSQLVRLIAGVPGVASVYVTLVSEAGANPRLAAPPLELLAEIPAVAPPAPEPVPAAGVNPQSHQYIHLDDVRFETDSSPGAEGRGN